MLRIYLLERIILERDGEVLLKDDAFRARQDRLLFAYFVLHRTRAVPREELAAVLWPGVDDAGSDSSLKALLSRLRSLLIPGTDLKLVSGGAQVQLLAPTDTWVDVEAAAYYADAAEVALRQGNDKAAFGPASATSVLAARAFLPGDRHPWVLKVRERLHRQRRALDCLARVWLAGEEPVLAVEAASHALALEPSRDTSCQLLLEAHRAAGNPAAGVQAYHRFRTQLRESLGVDPAPETERVYLQLLA